LRYYNFIILSSIFSANDFIKKNSFFVVIVLINGIKIYKAIIQFSGNCLFAEYGYIAGFCLSFRGYQVDLLLEGI
jgi:hypothetical protein